MVLVGYVSSVARGDPMKNEPGSFEQFKELCPDVPPDAQQGAYELWTEQRNRLIKAMEAIENDIYVKALDRAVPIQDIQDAAWFVEKLGKM